MLTRCVETHERLKSGNYEWNNFLNVSVYLIWWL